MLESIAPEFIGGLMAIVCAVIGARMATRSSEKQAKTKALQSAYADVFAGYYACIMDESDKNIFGLVSAIERTCLICSPEAEETMKEAVSVLVTKPIDLRKLGEKICLLREQAKKDVRKAK